MTACIRPIGFAAALVSMLWGFRALLFDHAPAVFSAPEEDLSHGCIVPLFSLYVLWESRARVRASAGRPSLAGLAAALPFLALGFLGARGIQVRFEIVAFAGLLVALVWAFWGRACARAVLFPAAYLLFCLPLATFLDVVTIHLRLLASGLSAGVLQGFGVDIVRRGTMLLAADGSFAIDVAAPCSGLRSVFALLALSAGYAYYLRAAAWRRVLLFASAVPLAVAGNVARILSICLVARFASAEVATGFYHDYSGYVVFLSAVGLLVALGEALRSRGATPDGDGAPPVRAAEPESRPLVASAAAAIVVSAMVFQGFAPGVRVASAPEVRLPDLPRYTAVESGASETEAGVLPPDTRIVRRDYSDADGWRAQVTAVVGGAGKGSIHRPELCQPAQGYAMSRPRTRVVGGVSWRLLTLSRGERAFGFAYTFFNQDGFRTSSHTVRIAKDVWDRSVLGRADRWVMVTVSFAGTDEARFMSFLEEMKGVVP
jgi:exosortase